MASMSQGPTRSRLVKALLVVTALLFALGVGFVIWVFHAASAAFGGESLSDPDDCITALTHTDTCEGEDRSFQECYYSLRATGVPELEVCRAFQSGRPNLEASAQAQGEPCPERNPGVWTEVACSAYVTDADYRCFQCLDSRPPEHNRRLIQAFSSDCQRAVVLKACNAPLLAPGSPKLP
jgi:hypothetical protein